MIATGWLEKAIFVVEYCSIKVTEIIKSEDMSYASSMATLFKVAVSIAFGIGAFLGGLLVFACVMMMPSKACAQIIGINTVTAHAAGGYRSWTPGLYARSADGLTAGILRNSEGSWGAHVSQTWRADVLGLPLDLQAGAITGYRRAPVLPLVTASVRIGHQRIVWIPGPRGGAMHLAVEW